MRAWSINRSNSDQERRSRGSLTCWRQWICQRGEHPGVTRDQCQPAFQRGDRLGGVIAHLELGDCEPWGVPVLRGVGRLAVGVERLGQVAGRLVALPEQVMEMRQERLVDLEPDAVELGDRLGEAVHLQEGEAVEVARAGARLVAADEAAILRYQGVGLTGPAQLEQDVGQPPGQVDVVAAGQQQAGTASSGPYRRAVAR